MSASSAVARRMVYSEVTPGSAGGLAGEIAFAGLDFQIFAIGADLDFAERAVFHRIGRSVADGVLAPHFVLEFAEGVLQIILAIDVEDVAAGVLRHLAQSRIADAAEGDAVAHVELAVDVIETVDEGVGALG